MTPEEEAVNIARLEKRVARLEKELIEARLELSATHRCSQCNKKDFSRNPGDCECWKSEKSSAGRITSY